jgi:tRNA dimethylallyltransferase
MITAIITGPTGAGKTRFALDLAQETHAQIISADSRQIYTGFRIGTAQPTIKELQRIPHHLVDFLTPDQIYSAGRFLQDVKALLLAHPKQNFIVTGGTAFYISGLLCGIPEIAPISNPVQVEVDQIYSQEGLSGWVKRLDAADPVWVAQADLNNEQRVRRALEVYLQTGSPLSSFVASVPLVSDSVPVFKILPLRETLYQATDQRVLDMFEQGWVNEVEGLLELYPDLSLPAWQSLGYKQIAEALVNGLNPIKNITKIQQSTRNYVKRQLTWFRNKQSGIIIDPNTKFQTTPEWEIFLKNP